MHTPRLESNMLTALCPEKVSWVLGRELIAGLTVLAAQSKADGLWRTGWGWKAVGKSEGHLGCKIDSMTDCVKDDLCVSTCPGLFFPELEAHQCIPHTFSQCGCVYVYSGCFFNKKTQTRPTLHTFLDFSPHFECISPLVCVCFHVPLLGLPSFI